MITDLESHGRWAFINRDHVFLSPPNTHQVEETRVGGQGTVTFPDDRWALATVPVNDNMPVLWAINPECADGGFVVDEEEGIHIHLVELKSNVNAGKWTTARLQFEGMLTNTLAALGFLESIKPIKITCHLALKAETITRSQRSNPIFSKQLVGAPGSVVGGKLTPSQEFAAMRVTILDYPDVPVKLIWRGSSGDGIGYFK